MAGSLANTRAIRTPVNPTTGDHVGHPSDIISDMVSKKRPLLSPWLVLRLEILCSHELRTLNRKEKRKRRAFVRARGVL